MGAPVNILVFWFRDDWGRYGRSYEKIASSLAGLPEVDQVVCVFPPEIVDDADAVAVALHERRLSPKLALLTERIRAHDSLLVGRAFQSIRRWRGRRRLGDYLRGRGFTSRNTILWMFPPHPYIDRIRRQVPHRLVVTHFIDNFKHFDTSHSLCRFAMKQYPQIGRWSDVIFTNSEPNRVEFSTAGVPCHRFAQGSTRRSSRGHPICPTGPRMPGRASAIWAGSWSVWTSTCSRPSPRGDRTGTSCWSARSTLGDT